MYYLYHIPGEKIGCTQQLEGRIKVQGYDNYEILETHTDIYVASDRERELQKQYGYRVDTRPYYQMMGIAKRTPATNRANGRSKSKINMQIAEEIRTRLKNGETGKALAKEYGILKSTVSMIKNNQQWVKE
jgi:hypothetical protein